MRSALHILGSWLVTGLWLTGSALAQTTTTTTYSMAIAVSMPKGSAAEKLATTQPTASKYTPCSPGKIDAITFTVSFNAGVQDKDVYLFFVSPWMLGADASSAQFYFLRRRNINSTGGGTAIELRNNVADVLARNTADIVYLPKLQNVGGTLVDTVMGSYVTVDGVPQGTWQLVGIVADSTKMSFADPSTWSAWDVATVVIGKPFGSSTNDTCTP